MLVLVHHLHNLPPTHTLPCTQQVPGHKVFCIWHPCACDSVNKIAASAHGTGSGGLAVDAMATGCPGAERRVERPLILSPDHFMTLNEPRSYLWIFGD